MYGIVVHFVSLLILLILYFTDSIPGRIDLAFLGFGLSVLVVNSIIFLFLRKEQVEPLKRQYCKISIIFLFSFIIVHFQAYFDFLLGNLTERNNFLWIDNSVVLKSMIISLIGILSYFIGYSLQTKSKVDSPSPRKLSNLNSLMMLGVILLGLFYVTVNPSYLRGNYSTSEPGTLAMYAALMFEAIIFSLIILTSRNAVMDQKHPSIKSYIFIQRRAGFLLLMYLPTLLMIGDRGPIIYLLLAYFIGYVYITKRKFPLAYLVFFILVGSLAMTVIGLARRMDNTIDLQERVELAARDAEIGYYPKSISNNTRELASSVRTLHMSVNYIENGGQHFYGLFFIQDLMLFVPSLRSTFVKMFSIPQPFTSSSQFLTFESQGQFYSWGVGTTSIADTFLDFGIIGVIVIYFVFGSFSRLMEIVIFSHSFAPLYMLICAFLLFAFSLYIPRSTLLYSLNKFTYIIVFCQIPRFLKFRIK